MAVGVSARDIVFALRATDHFSGVLRSVGRSLNNTNTLLLGNRRRMREAEAAASALAGTFFSTAERQAYLNDHIRTSIERQKVLAGRLVRTGAALTGMGTLLTGAGVAIGAFFASATQAAADLEHQARFTHTQVDNLTLSIQELADMSKRVSAEIPVPVDRVQAALYDIFSSIDVNAAEAEKLLAGFAREAIAGNGDIQEAARSTIAIMNGLGLGVEDLERIQDVQFQTVRKGVIDYGELSRTIGLSIPATSRAGQEIETLGAMIAFLTRNGLSATRASTSAARALELFAHPKTVERLEAMGVAVRDSNGEYRPLVDVFRDLNKITSEMTAPQRAALLQELLSGAGNNIQARRFWDVALKNFDEFEQHVAWQINSAGAFSEAYDTMFGSPTNQIQLFRNQVALLRLEFGDALLPTLSRLIEVGNQIVGWLSSLSPETKRAVAIVGALTAAGMAFAGVGLIIAGLLVSIVSGLVALGAGIGGAIAIVSGFAAVLALIPVAGYLIIRHWDTIRETAQTTWDTVRNAIVTAYEAARDTLSSWAETISGYIDSVVTAAENLGQKIDTALAPVGGISTMLAGLAYTAKVLVTRFTPLGTAISNVTSLFGYLPLHATGALATMFRVVGIIITRFTLFGRVIGILVGLAVFLYKNWDDVVRVFNNVMAVVGPVIDTVAGAISGFVSTVVDNVSGVVSGIFSTITSTVTGIWTAISGFFSGIYSTVVDALTPVVTVIVSVFQTIAAVAGPVIETIIHVLRTVVDIVTFMGGVFFTIFKAIGIVIMTVGRIIAKIIEISIVVAIGLMRMAMEWVGEVWQRVWSNISGFVTRAWNILQSIFKVVITFLSIMIPAALEAARNFFSAAWSAIRTIVSTAWNVVIKPVWQAISDFVNRVFGPVISWLGSVFRVVWTAIQAVIRTAWNVIRPYWQAAIDFLSRTFGPAVNAFRALWNTAWSLVSTILRTAKDRISTYFNNIVSFFRNLLGPAIDAFVRVWDEGWAGIRRRISEVWSGIKEGIRRGVNNGLSVIESFINRIIRGINNLIDLLNKIPGVNIGKLDEIKLPRVGDGPGVAAATAVDVAQLTRMHSGGVVGKQIGDRLEGLRSNEVLRVLEEGEVVIPKGVRSYRTSATDAFRRSAHPEPWRGTGDFLSDLFTKGPIQAIKDQASRLINPIFSTIQGSFIGDALSSVFKSLINTFVSGASKKAEESYLVPGNQALPGSAAIGGWEGMLWRSLWATVSAAFPWARLHSAYRPGAITATGNRSYHGMGRAIDITPSMEIFNWIRSQFGARTKELIFSPAGNMQIHNGRNHYYSGITRAMHFDHIHWAMANGGRVLRNGRYLIGEAGPELLSSRGVTKLVDRPTITNLQRGDMVRPLSDDMMDGGTKEFNFMPNATIYMNDEADMEQWEIQFEAWIRSRNL